MFKPSLFIAVILCLPSTSMRAAERIEIRGKAEKPAEANKPGFFLFLLDTHTPDLLVTASATIPVSFGQIDASNLIVRDKAGAKISSASVSLERGEDGRTHYEFNLRRDLLEKSQFQLVQRKKDGLRTATFILGSFVVNDPESVEKVSDPRPMRVALAEGGIFEKEDEFTPTDKIPAEEGVFYGFRLYLRGDGRSVPMRLELELPAPPKTWGNLPESEVQISKDGRTASHSKMIATEKLIEQYWAVAEGDPEGDYTVRVFIRDQLVKTFKLTVRRVSK